MERNILLNGVYSLLSKRLNPSNFLFFLTFILSYLLETWVISVKKNMILCAKEIYNKNIMPYQFNQVICLFIKGLTLNLPINIKSLTVPFHIGNACSKINKIWGQSSYMTTI